MEQEDSHFPIRDPSDLRRIATEICRAMEGTDDATSMALSTIAEYPPLYAASLGIMIAKLSATPADVDSNEWMAKFLLALAQDRVRSVFDRSGEPHWPEWLEDDS